MAAGDDVATHNTIKALTEQNRMLGMTNGAVNNFTAGRQEGDGSLEYDIEGDIARHIKFVKPPPRTEEPIPEPPSYYRPPPRLIEYRPAQPAPFAPDPPPSPPSNPEPESGPRTEMDNGVPKGWLIDPPRLRKHWME